MFKALTTVQIELNQVSIEADTVITIKDLGNGTLVGVYAGASFDITDDEYVKLSCTPSNLLH